MKVPTGRRQVKMFLQRFGSKIEVYEPVETQTALNHPEGQWTKIATEYAVRHFRGDDDEEKDYGSGRRIDSSPTLIFAIDTAVENDYHILYGVEKESPDEYDEYEVTAPMERGNHVQAEAKKRQEGTLLADLA